MARKWLRIDSKQKIIQNFKHILSLLTTTSATSTSVLMGPFTG